MMNADSKPVRGCGFRSTGLYLCISESPFGKPIEHFLVDPPVLWKSSKTLRSPMLIEDKQKINHICLGIGKKYYPFVSDFVEEAKVMGVSKRVSRTFDFSSLTPNKSRLLLVHPRAIPQFDYMVNLNCPTNKKEVHNCIGDLWPLSSVKSFKTVHETEELESGHDFRVTTPSCIYYVKEPFRYDKQDERLTTLGEYQSGIILMFPSFHLEWVNSRGEIPSKMKKQIEKAGFTIELKPY